MVQFLVIAQTASFKCVQRCYFSTRSPARGRPCRGPPLTPTPSLDVQPARGQENPALAPDGGTPTGGAAVPGEGAACRGQGGMETVPWTSVGRRQCSGACPVDRGAVLLFRPPAVPGLPGPWAGHARSDGPSPPCATLRDARFRWRGLVTTLLAPPACAAALRTPPPPSATRVSALAARVPPRSCRCGGRLRRVQSLPPGTLGDGPGVSKHPPPPPPPPASAARQGVKTRKSERK